MTEIVRSRTAMQLAALGAALAVLAEVLGVVAFAVLDVNSLGTFTDLGHAHDWLFFAGSLIVLGAVGLVSWGRLVQNHADTGPAAQESLELVGATVATFFIAIGSLVSATSTTTTTGATLTAVGIGLWGLLALSRAARHNLADRQAAAGGTLSRHTAIWLAVASGLVLLAVAYGITFGATSQGASIASGALAAVGVCLWGGAVAVAHNHGLLPGPLVPRVLSALALAAASFVAEVIVAATVFGSSGSVTGLRVGGAIIVALLGLSIAEFGYAAWLRVAELPVPAPAAGPVGPGTPAPPAAGHAEAAAPADPTTGPAARFCSSCGSSLADGVRSCPSCGAEVPAVP